MKLKYILYLITFSLFLNCKQKTLPKKDILTSKNTLENKDSIFNKVVITGTTDDIIAFEYLNIMNDTYLFGRPHLDVKKEIISDSLHMVLNSIEKPLFSLVQASGKENNFYRGWIFLIPGDTIGIKVNDGEMKFHGKNAVHNNFYSELNKNTPDYNFNPYQGNLMDYKNKVKSIYDQRTNFFQEYIKVNNIKSTLFINTIETNLKHEYLKNIIDPAAKKADFVEGLYFNESDILYNLFYREQDENPEAILDLKNYFEKVSITEFKNVNALNNSFFFKNNINAYIRYYFLDSKYLAYSKEKFLAEKEFIQNNFEGEIENYAIARMIRDYHLKGFGNSINSIELLKSTIDEYQERFTKPSYIEFMNDIKEDLESYDFEISESALNSKFINSTGDTLSLKDIFARSKKRIKVVDFWASWCPPCIKQIKEGKGFKDRLQVENNVEWIYISPEKDYEKWVKANKKFEHVLNFNNSFFLLKGRRSSLSRFFKVNEIPQYVIFNKENKIVLKNAPSPSDNVIFEEIIDEIYKN